MLAAKRFLLPSLLCLGGLLIRLDQPALWQDEAETAMLGESVLEHGYPKASLGPNTITVEPTLHQHETDSSGAFIWNTWLPYYLAAGSMKALGKSAFAARLPFAIFALLAYLLALVLFDGLDEPPGTATIAAWWLACSVPWLLLMRQCRYYSLVSFGTLAAVLSYRALLRGRKWGPVGLVASLFFLLNSSFVYAPITAIALAGDALLQKERSSLKTFWVCLAAFGLLGLPIAIHFKAWSRPGNHSYPAIESLRFLRTFLSWISRFALPPAILLPVIALDKTKRWFALLGMLLAALVLDGEGPWADLGSLALLVGLIAFSIKTGSRPARLIGLLAASNLAVLSISGAEPYGRYLAPLLPFLCWVGARLLMDIPYAAAIAAAALLTSNTLFILPGKIVASVAPKRPLQTPSGMMRQRLRNLPFRSEPYLFWNELLRSRTGYLEPIAEEMHRRGGAESFYSDADNLSLLFLVGGHALLPEELLLQAPRWIVPSPWLILNHQAAGAVEGWLKSKPYEAVDIGAPLGLWQDNPDVLFHNFNPAWGARRVYRLGGPKTD